MTFHLVKSLFGSKSLATLLLATFLVSCASKTHVEKQEEKDHRNETNTYLR